MGGQLRWLGWVKKRRAEFWKEQRGMECRSLQRLFMPDVDLGAYAGREQAYIKHCLLEKYLPDWGYKIGTAWDNLVYVDGFAGPWGVTDQDSADSSFGVAINVLRKMRQGLRDRGRSINIRSVLVER